MTDVQEDNTRTFASDWSGTGQISGSGDAETICLDVGEYMESEVVNTGIINTELLQNDYDGSGDNVVLKYRHGDTEENCLGASWTIYTISFESLGYVQIRLEATP